MNDTNLQEITLTKRDRNYSNLKGLESSLRHSLRLKQNEYDDFEFNPNPPHHNIAIVDGVEQELTKELAEKLLAEFTEKIQAKVKETEASDEIAEEKEKLRKLKSKLNKFINATDAMEVKEYVVDVMEGDKPLSVEEYAALLNTHKISRIAQRIDLLENYTNKKKEVEQNAPDRAISRTVNRVKEMILVIPEPNGLEITKEYTDLLQRSLLQFYEKNFPNNKMVFSFSHLDETTNHVHAFLDLQNEKTGKYDFSAQEFDFAIKYYAANKSSLNISEPPKLEDFKLPNRSEEKQNHRFITERESWKSMVMQAAFYDHFNDIAIQYGLQAKFLEKNRKNKKHLKFIEQEAKKPKSERSHNFYTKRIEDLKKQVLETKAELATHKASAASLSTTVNDLQNKASTYSNTIQTLEIKATEQQKKNAQLDNQGQELAEEIIKKENKTQKLEANFKETKKRMAKELNNLKKEIQGNAERKAELENAIRVFEEKLEPLIKRFDILVDQILEAKTLDENLNQYYRRLRENTYETASRLGPEKRKDYLFNVQEHMKEKGLDHNKAGLGVKEKVKLWATDTFNNQQVVEFDKEEVKHAAESRKRRMLKPKPLSPFKDPYDPYQ